MLNSVFICNTDRQLKRQIFLMLEKMPNEVETYVSLNINTILKNDSIYLDTVF